MTSDRERVEGAVEILSQPEAAGLLRLAVKELCRERPEWWLAFLRREERARGGRALR